MAPVAGFDHFRCRVARRQELPPPGQGKLVWGLRAVAECPGLQPARGQPHCHGHASSRPREAWRVPTAFVSSSCGRVLTKSSPLGHRASSSGFSLFLNRMDPGDSCSPVSAAPWVSTRRSRAAQPPSTPMPAPAPRVLSCVRLRDTWRRIRCLLRSLLTCRGRLEAANRPQPSAP